MVLSIKMDINVVNTIERKHTPRVQVTLVGLARVKMATEKDREIVIRRIKLSSRFVAFTKGVFRYLHKTALQIITSETPTVANRRTRIDVTLDQDNSTSGISKHRDLSS